MEAGCFAFDTSGKEMIYNFSSLVCVGSDRGFSTRPAPVFGKGRSLKKAGSLNGFNSTTTLRINQSKLIYSSFLLNYSS